MTEVTDEMIAAGVRACSYNFDKTAWCADDAGFVRDIYTAMHALRPVPARTLSPEAIAVTAQWAATADLNPDHHTWRPLSELLDRIRDRQAAVPAVEITEAMVEAGVKAADDRDEPVGAEEMRAILTAALGASIAGTKS